MAAPIIPTPAFPDVPKNAGVPQIARAANAAIPTIVLAVQAIRKILSFAKKTPPTWGVFNEFNQQVVKPDSVLTFDNRNEYRVSDFPVQKGAFASYNKVLLPFEVSVRFSKGGTQQDRKQFLDDIARVAGTLNLYTILTPERSYTKCNVTRYEVSRRGAEGAFFLAEVDLYFRQVIEVASQYSTTNADTSSAQDPSAVPSVTQGNVQTSDVPPSVVPKVTAAVAGQGS